MDRAGDSSPTTRLLERDAHLETLRRDLRAAAQGAITEVPVTLTLQ